MAHHLVFGKIHIIEWLWKNHPDTGLPERRTGQEIYNELRSMIAEAGSATQVILHRVSSARSFLERLERIEEDFRLTGRIPLLHVETHGDENGIGLGDDGLEWPELMKALTPLNVATACWLPVFLAACESVRGMRMAQVMQRAPFYVLMGPKREVYPGEVFRGLRAFYRKVIVDGDGPRAMLHLNTTIDPDEDTFHVFNCEQLFRDIWGWYLDGDTVDEIMVPLFEEMLAERQAEKPMTADEVEKLRAHVQKYVLDYRPRFEESRRHFFMTDLAPGNAARFNLLLKENGGRWEIAEP